MNAPNSPHRLELDRLLEKIDHGKPLTDDEMVFAKELLWEIITAPEAEGISKGEKSLAGDIYAGLVKRRAIRETHV